MQKALSIIIPCLLGWVCTYLSIEVYEHYSWGLFAGIPFVLGISSTLIYSLKNDVRRKSLRNNAYLTFLVLSLGIIVFAIDGLICLVMAAPVAFLFTYLGFLLAYLLFVKGRVNHTSIILLVIFSLPLIMSFENSVKKRAKIRSVTTSIEIKNTPEKVWDFVIAFPQLAEPKELIFKTGIAYPINATIDGSGTHAIRYCNFSTGSFVEPITTWDQPHLLAFTVTHQPATMKEVSPYKISPRHLHGYWTSVKGQFKLTQLANGNTLLEGTTWYKNKIAPDFYWTMWSDYIVHKIHERVLEHIKQQAELQH